MVLKALRKVFSFLLDIAETLVFSLVFFIIIWAFFLRPFQVNGLSMFPSFKDKQYVLTNIIGLHFSSPKVGDVVVFKSPMNNEEDFIKRVIGVPFDKVMVKSGLVYINGKTLDESTYVKKGDKTYGGAFLKEGLEVEVPKDSYVVLGDNRLYSSDSREWGFVPKDFIIGTSFFAYWPIEEAKPIKNPFEN
ncbi:MAG: signal peptidase I [Candidatus Levybacteria bacterium]|nr:signal peptidase I [Candidatus Levybacteria bacterium]